MYYNNYYTNKVKQIIPSMSKEMDEALYLVCQMHRGLWLLIFPLEYKYLINF